MAKGYYKCECGKEFYDSQKFNSHKGHCDVHLTNKYGSIEVFREKHQRNHEGVPQKNRENASRKKEEAIKAWVSEEHRCECCGKIMIEKFGSGRFCSRSCANSRKLAEEQRAERRANLMNNPNLKLFRKSSEIDEEEAERYNQIRRLGKLKIKNNYELNPRKCIICGSTIDYQHRNNKTCCKECRNRLNLLNNADRNFYNSKKGKFDGILFDSTYELAFYIYCKDNNIQCIRNTEVCFPYIYEDKTHYYYPDFYIPQINTYIELKGRKKDIDEIKIRSAIEHGAQIKLLKEDDLHEVFNFIKNKYNLQYNSGGNNFYLLYDNE